MLFTYLTMQEAARLALDKVTSAVLIVNIGSDSKAIKRAIDEIKKVRIQHRQPFSIALLANERECAEWGAPFHFSPCHIFVSFIGVPGYVFPVH